MSRGLLTLLAGLLLAPGPARAAVVGSSLDPELAVPYRWRVVVQFAPGPLFTPAFRAQLLSDTRAALQPTLGALGTVEVLDLAAIPDAARDPLTREFALTGWPALDSPKFRELTGVKTHFLKLAADGGAIKLQARQHDGSTGLALPVLRVKETRDPQTVNRLAGLLLARDFGPTATVEVPDAEADTVKVRFRGGALPGLDRHLKIGDVLVVSEVYEQRRPDPPQLTSRTRPKVAETLPPLHVARPREYTLLRLESMPENGVARCRVLTRFSTAFNIARTLLGVRAMKVATTEAPVELRIVDQNGRPPAANTLLQVRASDVGFLPTAEPRDRLDFRDGLFRSGRPLRNVACVVVTVGTSHKLQYFPVPILDGQPVTLKFPVDPKLAALVEYENRLEVLSGRLRAAQDTQRTLVEELARLIVAGKNPQALERAVTGLLTLEGLDKELAALLAALRLPPEAGGAESAAALAYADAGLKALREGRPGIAAKVEELRKSIGTTNDPANFERAFAAKERALSIRRAVEAGDVEQALAEYDLLFELTKQESTKELKAKLEAEWKPRSPEHKKARDFVLNAWRQLADPAAHAAALDRLADAAKTMTDNQDRLGLRNLLTALDQTYTKLKDALDRLDPETDGDKPTIEQIKALTPALRKIETEAIAAVTKIENPR